MSLALIRSVETLCEAVCLSQHVVVAPAMARWSLSQSAAKNAATLHVACLRTTADKFAVAAIIAATLQIVKPPKPMSQ